jgi:hypothetical protein
MTKSAFLLAGKKVLVQTTEKRKLLGGLVKKDAVVDEDEGEGIIDWDLARAADVGVCSASRSAASTLKYTLTSS